MKQKLEKFYTRGDIFKSYIASYDILPITVKLKRVTQKDISQNYTTIQKELKKLKELKLPLVYKEFSFKSIGVQKLPVEVRFENLEEYLNFIAKLDEYEKFKETYQNIVKKYPSLKELFLKKPFWILDYYDKWERILRVVDFMSKNQTPDCYIRELSIKDVDTKFIEKHKKLLDNLLSNILQKEPLKSLSDFSFEKKYGFKYPLSQVRFRILDSKYFINGLSDLTLNIKEFKKLDLDIKRVFIIENKVTFLSFFDIKNSIVIFGSGYKISLLKSVEWLKNKDIIYWGDIDEDGFAILSNLRGYFPQIKSIMMDIQTIEKFIHLKVHYNKKSATKEKLSNLTKDEMLVYERLKNDFYAKNFRLEQERIPFEYVKRIVL